MYTYHAKMITAELAQLDTPKHFSKWIWRELALIYAQKGGHLLRLNMDDPDQALACIYNECVSEGKKPMFRQAIGDILLEQGNKEDVNIEAIRDLLYLSVRIYALEPFDALLSTVGSGLLGKRDKRLLSDTVSALGSFPPSAKLNELASKLIDCDNFDDGYLFAMIEILVGCEPSNTKKIINDLTPRLIKLRDEAKEIGGEEWDAFTHVVEFYIQHWLKFYTKIDVGVFRSLIKAPLKS